ncbi:putative secreted protein (Por secretion system target) [Arcicella aurantiaca]|uniref:Putative secreted protein (Por secretion system target) n=1 Tax=Arcicella aurantiaca TaxID=591202 RepID=A0A316E9H8_9BACT|nr:S8/S53 family peptidase [Arcicella aurantiaca]PWK26720.1 putative secreted protein (Por secretion system target) [Arcicella aurantiaca]
MEKSSQLSVISKQLSVNSYQLSVIGYWLLVIGYYLGIIQKWIRNKVLGSVCYLLFTVYCSLFTATQKWIRNKVLGSVCYLLFTVYCSLFTATQKWIRNKVLGSVCYLLFTVYCSLFTATQKWIRNKVLGSVCYLLFTVYCSLFTANCSAQGKYLITFKDKNNSPYSVSKPLEFLSQRSVNRRIKQKIAVNTRDLPVNPSYLTEITKAGGKIWFTSRWMNAALVQTTEANLTNILKLSFVKGLEINGTIDDPRTRTGRQKSKFEALETEAFNYGLAKTQNEMIGVNTIHDLGLQGQGMMIGVLDAGFNNANNIPALKAIFDEKRIVGTYDFVKKETSVYEDDGHGTAVLSCMGAYTEGSMIGSAPKASYLLLRSEDAPSEYIIEEANWLFAAEYADSVGVDLINSSLGYTTFDDAKTDHTYADLNGNKTIAARAADWAAAVGIVCVISAGNEGNGAWKYIGTPADADSVIAVGAVTATKTLASFSSLGIPTDKRIKPDLMAMGQSVAVVAPTSSVTTSSGTSFSSPILCGMLACYWQAYPNLTAIEVIDKARKSGSQYDNPDNKFGYGIPNLSKSIQILNTQNELETWLEVFPNPTKNEITIRLRNFTGKTYELNLTDIAGRRYLSETMDSQIKTISLDKISSGMYFLRVGNDEKNSLIKLWKE